MRKPASLASSYRQRRLPASLMQRLEVMQNVAQEAKALAEGRPYGAAAAKRTTRRGAHVIVLAWFSLGALTSGASGVGAVLALRAMSAGEGPVVLAAWMPGWARSGWERKAPASRTMAAADAAAPAAEPASVPEPDTHWEIAEVAINRSERDHAPLALQITGADDLAVDVMIEGVPAGARLSHGRRLGISTWLVERGDLGHLTMALDETVPAAFDIRIGLMPLPAGVAATGSIVQVRLVNDGTRQLASGAGGTGPAAQTEQAIIARAASVFGPAAGPAAREAAENAPPVQAREPAARAPSATAAETTTAAARTWPEGASGLGAVARQPENPPWWSAPSPTWSPFQDGSRQP